MNWTDAVMSNVAAALALMGCFTALGAVVRA
jgi:hypothetical protein